MFIPLFFRSKENIFTFFLSITLFFIWFNYNNAVFNAKSRLRKSDGFIEILRQINLFHLLNEIFVEQGNGFNTLVEIEQWVIFIW